jgi:magnesium transporter
LQQGEIVRKISGWAPIIAVPTFIASIYGMNFERMPELTTPLGYPGVLVLMALIALGLHRTLRRADWL